MYVLSSFRGQSLCESGPINPSAVVNSATIRQHLERCGYRRSMLRPDFPVGDGHRIPLVAFAQPPADARSACIVVLDGSDDVVRNIGVYRQIGAPILFACRGPTLEWWSIQANSVERQGASIACEEVPAFFEKYSAEFSPDAVYRAKTWGRFESQFQLSFVDIGLMPLVEGEAGHRLEDLIVRNLSRLKRDLGWDVISKEQGGWLLQSVFWLVSAKIMKDKGVATFDTLGFEHPESIFETVAKHYDTNPIPISNQQQREGLGRVAADVARFSHLGLVTTESLAHVYENTLISKETRQSLGTHSTPAYLVDYVVGRLRPWIEAIPQNERSVFEPACGHAAFLVSAMRVLTELLPFDQAMPSQRRRYLRSRIHGCDIDAFALEIARLSLTLTDVPNPDGWDLTSGDMFVGDLLEQQSRRATILLANPPFENFSAEEKVGYAQRGAELQYINKTAEMLGRSIPQLPKGGTFGVVVPQGFLHHKNATPLRRLLVKEFDIQEICLFPDKVFRFSDMESAILLGRRKKVDRRPSPTASYRRVRERDMAAFRTQYRVTSDRRLRQADFEGPVWDLRIPDLQEVWEYCAANQTFENIALVGIGMVYKGRDLPEDAQTYSEEYFPGAVRGFVRFLPRLQLHETPHEMWMSLDPDVIRRPHHGTVTGLSQVLFNEARSSRGPWRLKALIDREGHAVTGRFNVVRPKDRHLPLEFLWALCNSPFSNAYAYTHAHNRHNDAGMVRRMPIPELPPEGVRDVAQAARCYLEYVSHEPATFDRREARARMLRVDNAVLRLYALPVALERQLLDLFADWKREGVPFEFVGYFPSHFQDHLSLDDLLAITEDWSQTNQDRGELIQRKHKKRLKSAEEQELRRLQELATCRRRLVAPLPLAELADLHKTFVGGS